MAAGPRLCGWEEPAGKESRISSADVLGSSYVATINSYTVKKWQMLKSFLLARFMAQNCVFLSRGNSLPAPRIPQTQKMEVTDKVILFTKKIHRRTIHPILSMKVDGNLYYRPKASGLRDPADSWNEGTEL